VLARAREEVPGPVQAMIRDARRILSIDPLASEGTEEEQPRSPLKAFQDWWFAHRVGLLRIEQVGFFQNGEQFLAETPQEKSGPAEEPFGSRVIADGHERVAGWVFAVVGVIGLVAGVVGAVLAVDVEDYVVMTGAFLAGVSFLSSGIYWLRNN
jgi:hypothetical protein